MFLTICDKYLNCICWSIYLTLSYNVASERDISPCNKMDKQLVVYIFSNKT